MKKFIFFRNDRLGDFIILTHIILSIKKKYKDSHISVLCSPLNYNLIRKYKIIDKVYVYNKKSFLLKRFFLFKEIIRNSYFASFAVDGKSFSNLCNFFIKAKYKLGLVYNYKILNFWFSKPNFLYNYFTFDNIQNFTSKNNLKKIEHLPQKFSNLARYIGIKSKVTNKYYFKYDLKEHIKFKKFYKDKIKNKYVLIHLDEKWVDIDTINYHLYQNLVKLQKTIKKKIIITSYNNNFQYFLNLKKDLFKNKKDNKIILVTNSNLFFFERLIKHSFCSISCHSGFLVQVAGSNSSKVIDIIHKNDFNWYSSWKPKNTNYKVVFKSSLKNLFPINQIFSDLSSKIKSF